MAAQFALRCDGHIALYIQEHGKFFNDLKSKVGQVARCKSLAPDHYDVWKVTVEKKLVRKDM